MVAFIRSGDAVAAWVAIVDDHVIGHIAVHTSSSPGVIDFAAVALQVVPAQLGVVARLFVDPAHRGTGIAQRLLDVAVEFAATTGLIPILDVVTTSDRAIRLYERCGWEPIGEVEYAMPHGVVLRERVYVAPTSHSAST